MKKRDDGKYEAPDGGWGWMVCISYAVNNMMIIPGFQIFPLLYRGVLKDNNLLSALSVIVSLNAAFGMILGLFNGPILSIFSYRKVAIFGAVLVFIGNFMTSQATQFYEFIIFYCIIVSSGVNLVMSSFSVALNTYFVKKRGMATGLAMTATGIGPIVMPLIVEYFMSYYGCAKYPGFILAALSLHSFVGALLLHPVKWHSRIKVPVQDPIIKSAKKFRGREEVSGNDVNGETILLNNLNDNDNLSKASDDGVGKDVENGEIKTLEESRNVSNADLNNFSEGEKLREIYHQRDLNESKESRKEKFKLRKLAPLFNFQLLKDFGFLNIVIGLSLAFVGEMNFALMVPGILLNLKYETNETAVIMSVIAGADISSRFFTPFLNKYSNHYAKFIFTLSLNFGVFAKLAFVIFQESYHALIVVAVMLGIAKGFRTVFMTLIIPNSVTLEQLPSATGIQMFTNGLALGLMGKVFGAILDNYGTNTWVYTINCFTLTTVFLWTAEYFLMRRRKKNSEQT